jgi:hypothetical protein
MGLRVVCREASCCPPGRVAARFPASLAKVRPVLSGVWKPFLCLLSGKEAYQGLLKPTRSAGDKYVKLSEVPEKLLINYK